MKKLSLVYVPLEVGAKYGGTQQAPELFKNLGLEQQLQSQDFEVANSQTVECTPRDQLQPTPEDRPYIEEILRVNNQVAQATQQAVNNQQIVVGVGGDHSINLGFMAGASAAVNGDIGLIYIDAHGDMNTPESSTSHNVHGMHLAALMGFGTQDMINCYQPGVKLPANQLLHVAGKDLDQFEKELIKQENIVNYSIDDIQLHGLNNLLPLINDLNNRVSNIWVSFDLDAIDLTYAPGVGIPNKGGLTYREATTICRYIANNTNLVGFDIVECNPPRDIDNQTAQVGIDLIFNLLGGDSLQYSEYMANL